MNQALFIFDFDLTISQVHVHNKLATAIYTGKISPDNLESQWQLIKDIPPTGSTLQWNLLFSTLINQGHLVAIASFGAYPVMIQWYLEKKLEIKPADIEQIFINSWLPDYPADADKNKHIEEVIAHFAFHGKPNQIILIDDSETNCRAARQMGYQVIEALPGDRNARHLQWVWKLLEPNSEKRLNKVG